VKFISRCPLLTAAHGVSLRYVIRVLYFVRAVKDAHIRFSLSLVETHKVYLWSGNMKQCHCF
jgi:hypothetical protein